MVNYCLGNVGAMRRKFRSVSGESVVSLDNDDVLADFLLNGKIFFVLGDIPCGNMNVGEFLSYNRALKTKLPLGDKGCKILLKKVGLRISLNKKLSAVNRIKYRRLQLASKLEEETQCIYVNFDGISYSRRANAKIKRLLKLWGKKWQVVAGFCDYRFVPKKATPTIYLSDGEALGHVKQKSKSVCRGVLKRALNKHSLAFKWTGVKGVVRCDN